MSGGYKDPLPSAPAPQRTGAVAAAGGDGSAPVRDCSGRQLATGRGPAQVGSQEPREGGRDHVMVELRSAVRSSRKLPVSVACAVLSLFGARGPGSAPRRRRRRVCPAVIPEVRPAPAWRPPSADASREAAGLGASTDRRPCGCIAACAVCASGMAPREDGERSDATSERPRSGRVLMSPPWFQSVAAQLGGAERSATPTGGPRRSHAPATRAKRARSANRRPNAARSPLGPHARPALEARAESNAPRHALSLAANVGVWSACPTHPPSPAKPGAQTACRPAPTSPPLWPRRHMPRRSEAQPR